MTLGAELERNRVVGSIGTPIDDVYRKARGLAEGDRAHSLGLGHLLPTTVAEIVEALGSLTGRPVTPEGARDGRSYIDPATVERQAAAAGERLRSACERRERVLFGTGHPAGPLALYIRLAGHMQAHGADVMQFAEGESFSVPGWKGRCQVRYVCGVACLYGGGGLLHTHDAEPMEYLLDTGPRPDLVVGDHGFAGVALARGAEAVALVDTNDPALALAWQRGLPVLPVMCDDNRTPDSYDPLLAALVAALR